MFRKINNNIKKKSFAGFTMIEVVFGIFIIGIIGTSFFAVMGKMLKAQYSLRDKIIATNLAQEGIEIIRNQRDNMLKSLGHYNVFDDAPFEPSNPTVCQNNNNDHCAFATEIDSYPAIHSSGVAGFAKVPIDLTAKFDVVVTIKSLTGSRSAGACGATENCRLIVAEVFYKNGTKLVSLTDTLWPWGNYY